ncbi:hypothetical protein AX774_g4931, partial [Zancudomyces culisetae]
MGNTWIIPEQPKLVNRLCSTLDVSVLMATSLLFLNSDGSSNTTEYTAHNIHK